jgi:hypothetical protein
MVTFLVVITMPPNSPAPTAPTVTSVDVERIVRRHFPADQVAEALAVLNEYGKEDWQREPHRVRLAVLKIVSGKLKSLRIMIKGAQSNYDIVLNHLLPKAEYPSYRRRMRICGPPLSPDAWQRIIDTDWKQYQDWLTR